MNRWFGFREQEERMIVDAMRDIDDTLVVAKEQYPDNTWNRQEIMQLLFGILTIDKLEWIGENVNQE